MGILQSLHYAHQQRKNRIDQAAIKHRCTGLDDFSIISNEICQYYNIRKEDLFSRRRQAFLSEKRQIFVYMLYYLTRMTHPEIALKLSRHTSSIDYTIRKIQSNLQQYTNDVEILSHRLKPNLHQPKETT